jgi:hypothetical protein
LEDGFSGDEETMASVFFPIVRLALEKAVTACRAFEDLVGEPQVAK